MPGATVSPDQLAGRPPADTMGKAEDVLATVVESVGQMTSSAGTMEYVIIAGGAGCGGCGALDAADNGARTALRDVKDETSRAKDVGDNGCGPNGGGGVVRIEKGLMDADCWTKDGDATNEVGEVVPGEEDMVDNGEE